MRHRLLGGLFCAAAVLSLTLFASRSYANDNVPDAPDVLAFVAEQPTEGINTQPIERYKELADTVITRLKRDNPDAKFTAVVNTTKDDKQREKVRLLIVSEAVSATTITFKSNCSVNSRFSVQPVPQITQVDSDDGTPSKNYAGHWLGDVCAKWTLLNHAWVDPDAPIPKDHTAQLLFGDTLDVTYNRKEVEAYEAAVAALARPNGQKLVRR